DETHCRDSAVKRRPRIRRHSQRELRKRLIRECETSGTWQGQTQVRVHVHESGSYKSATEVNHLWLICQSQNVIDGPDGVYPVALDSDTGTFQDGTVCPVDNRAVHDDFYICQGAKPTTKCVLGYAGELAGRTR